MRTDKASRTARLVFWIKTIEGTLMNRFERFSGYRGFAALLVAVAFLAGCGSEDEVLGGRGGSGGGVGGGPGAVASCAVGNLPLGTAATYAVLAGTALTVTNPTSVTGDVGSPSITPAGGPIPLTGTLHDSGTDPAPGVIEAAVGDMQTAIGCAGSRACTFNYGAATDFGGMTLAPGVHCVAGGMSVGSNLTLSTPGVYVFRSSGTLTSAPTVTVAFAGAASAANTSVFWVPSGASIGATNTFLGTIMVDPGAITLGAGTTLQPGRVLSSSAVTLDTNTIAIP